MIITSEIEARLLLNSRPMKVTEERVTSHVVRHQRHQATPIRAVGPPHRDMGAIRTRVTGVLEMEGTMGSERPIRRTM